MINRRGGGALAHLGSRDDVIVAAQQAATQIASLVARTVARVEQYTDAAELVPRASACWST